MALLALPQAGYTTSKRPARIVQIHVAAFVYRKGAHAAYAMPDERSTSPS